MSFPSSSGRFPHSDLLSWSSFPYLYPFYFYPIYCPVFLFFIIIIFACFKKMFSCSYFILPISFFYLLEYINWLIKKFLVLCSVFVAICNWDMLFPCEINALLFWALGSFSPEDIRYTVRQSLREECQTPILVSSNEVRSECIVFRVESPRQ